MTMSSCPLDMLFDTYVPHILEKIFFYLDYASYKECLEVSVTWNKLLTSESYQKKGKLVFHDELQEDQKKIWNVALARKGSEDEVLRLLRSGMLDVISRRPGLTLLHTAVNRSHKDVIKILLGKGADPNIPNGMGWTPFHVAANNDNEDVFQLLLNGGGDLNMPTSCGWTLLHLAIRTNSLARIELLLQRGADINEKTDGGLTALHLAAKRGFNDVVIYLLDKGALPHKINKKSYWAHGYTPTSIAQRFGHTDTVKILMNYFSQ